MHYKDLVDKSFDPLNRSSLDETFFSIKHITFNFRTLQSKPGILLHISLKPNDQLYFEIMLKNELELEFAYPNNGRCAVHI